MNLLPVLIRAPDGNGIVRLRITEEPVKLRVCRRCRRVHATAGCGATA